MEKFERGVLAKLNCFQRPGEASKLFQNKDSHRERELDIYIYINRLKGARSG